jgi:predicted DNA-binding transcriptional regulator YafY
MKNHLSFHFLKKNKKKTFIFVKYFRKTKNNSIMQNQESLEKLLKILMTLSNDLGYTPAELAEMYDTNQRIVSGYIKTLRDAGFIVSETEGKLKVDKKSPYYKEISRLLHFSDEEAYILNKAIHSIDNVNEIKNNLINKLYSLYDFDRVAVTVVKRESSENVHQLTQAIKHKHQVILHNYASANSSKVSNRLVEPFDFTTNYISVWCYEVESGKNKLFKTSRIWRVELLNENWKHESKHQQDFIDMFRIGGKEKMPIQMKLSLRAFQLIIEEFPLSEKVITPIENNQYLFDGWVTSFNGIGRFVLGLPEEVEVISPDAFKDFLNKKIINRRF